MRRIPAHLLWFGYFVATLLGATDTFASTKPTNPERAWRCRQSFKVIAQAYRRTARGGEIADPQAFLARNQADGPPVIVDSKLGVVELLSYEDNPTGGPGTILVRRPGDRPNQVTRVQLSSNQNMAEAGTDAARAIMEERANKRFGGLKNFPVAFILSGITSHTESLRHAASFGHPRMQAAWKLYNERRGTTLEAAGTFEDKLKRWRALSNTIFHKRSSKPIISDQQAQEILDFAQAFYDISGENLIRTGILRANFIEPEATGGVTFKQMSSLTHLVGGGLKDVPYDIYHYIVVENWKAADQLEAKRPGTPLHFAPLTRYSSDQANDPTTPSGRIREFKETGDLAKIQPILDSSKEIVQTMGQQIQQTGGTAMVVPVPGLSNLETPPTTALADWVARELGSAERVDVFHRAREVASQKMQGTLWERIDNVSRQQLFVPMVTSNKVEGRDIVLVDDVSTSGATAAALIMQLHRMGARSVRVITLGDTDPAGHAYAVSPASPTKGEDPEVSAQPVPTPLPAAAQKKTTRRSTAETAEEFNRIFAASGKLPGDGLSVTQMDKEQQQLLSVSKKAVREYDLNFLTMLESGTLEAVLQANKITDKSVEFYVECFNRYAASSQIDNSSSFAQKLDSVLKAYRDSGQPLGAYPNRLNDAARKRLGLAPQSNDDDD